MITDIMIDLETLSTRPNAVITNLAAIKFDPFGNDINSIDGDTIKMNTFYRRVDPGSFDWPSAHIDPNTIDWWSKQEPAVMEEAFTPEGRLPLADCIDQFHKFAWGCDAFWAHGSLFDIAILEDLYRQLNKPVPWNYWQVRDTRTLFDLGWDYHSYTYELRARLC